MNIFHVYKKLISEYASLAFPELPNDINFTVESPKDNSHGDISTNIALITSKLLKSSPISIASKICVKLNQHDDIESSEPAGPGFINIKLKSEIWYNVLNHILDTRHNYGNSNIGNNKTINIEFVSCNPTGPMHIGHARGAVFGDCLARILKKSGFNPVKEFYVNDAGSQITTLLKSVHIRYLQALGEDVKIPEGCYPGDYLIPIANQLVKKFDNQLQSLSEEQIHNTIRDFVLEQMLSLIKQDLALLGVHHEIFLSEKKELHDKGVVAQAINYLKDKKLVYEGFLEKPKGKTIEEWEAKEQTIFKAKQFGDDVDRPLIKSNGDYTYFAGDVAYHYNKIKRGFEDMILVLGADHIGYKKRIKAAVEALSDGKANIDVKISQLVNLLQNGQPYKMSKRAGNFVTVKEMVEDLGTDIIRFIMLTRKEDSILDLDFALAKEESKENPIFYVQYAHARASSLLRKAKEQKITPNRDNLKLLSSAEEITLIKKLAQWPRILETSAISHEPHKITYYLYELANLFHSFWNMGTDNAHYRFIIENNKPISEARTCLAEAIKYTLASALDTLGIKAMEVM